MGKLGVAALASVSLIEKGHVDTLKAAFAEASKSGKTKDLLIALEKDNID